MATTYAAGDIKGRLTGKAPHPSNGMRQTTIRLEAGDRAWNPASTKGDITGPATVTYYSYSDGGIDTMVTR